MHVFEMQLIPECTQMAISDFGSALNLQVCRCFKDMESM